MIHNQWLEAGVVLAVLAALLIGLHVYRARRNPHPETVRKLLHIGMGCVALTFPWIFTSPAPVFALAAIAIALLVALRHVDMLKAIMGGVVDAVDRVSKGELYFPIGIALSFWLSGGDPLLYSTPILILTLADAVAALIGIRYGTAHYATIDGSKSVEGSAAFFFMAYLCTQILLLLLSNVGRAETLLISLIMGILIMLVEAVAWRGLDNLLIPILGFLLLKSFVKLQVADLVVNLVVIAAMAALAFFYRSRTTLDDNALLSAVLLGYFLWTIGGGLWLYPVVVLFARERLLSFRSATPTIRRYTVRLVLTVGLPGLFWLVLESITNQPLLYFPYVLTFATHLSIFEMVRLATRYPDLSRAWVFTIAVVIGWLMLVPYVLIMHATTHVLFLALIGLVPIALGAGGFLLFQPRTSNAGGDMPLWARQGLGAMFASTASLVPLAWSGSLHA